MTAALGGGGGKAVATTGDMREYALLVLTGCLVTTDGPVVASSDPIIAVAANEFGIVWAAQPPGRAVNLWSLEYGVYVRKIGSVPTLDRLAAVRHEVYASSGHEVEIVGAQGKFLAVRTGNMIMAFDPVASAPDHDSWSRTWSAPGTPDATVGHGMLAVDGPDGWRTFELGGTATAVTPIGAHAPTLVRPIANGIAFASAGGLFTSVSGEITQVAEADDWAHLVELDDVLWAATAGGDRRSRLIRIEEGESTELDAPGDVVELAVGDGSVYAATQHGIYRADRARMQ